MTWFRNLARRPDRCCRRPVVENLEVRNLLTAGTNVANSLLAPVENLIGAAATRDTYHVDGSGLTAAVIDTGVNYRNANLGGGFGPGHKVIAGFDFGDGDGDPIAASQHGTSVAGLLAGNEPSHLGVAPGADIVALKVFKDDGSSDFSKIVSALQWVVDNHSQYNISVVNISISDGGNYNFNWFQFDGGIGQKMGSLVDQLAKLNIPVVTATGNSFNGTEGQGFPSIIPETISVTGSDPSDKLLGEAQRLDAKQGGASATDLAAPGSGLTGPSDGDSYTGVSGTSFAAPVVSGSIMLLQELYASRFGQLPTLDQINSWLKAGADTITDSVTGMSIGRIDILKSAGLVPAAPSSGDGGSGTGTGTGDGTGTGTDTGNGGGTGTDTGNGGGTGTDGGGTGTDGGGTVTPPPVTVPPLTTQTYLNGQSTGVVDATSAANPFNNVGTVFGNGATVTNSQSFTGANIPNQAKGTTLTVNGVYQGVVDPQSDANPFAAIQEDFGTVTAVQTWTNSTGTPTPAGSLGVRRQQRKAFHAARRASHPLPAGPARLHRFANQHHGR